MKITESKIPSSLLIPFRIICYLCGIYFFLMGLLLIVVPQMAIKNTGVQNPTILGILRGTGGAVIFSLIWYILIAQRPLKYRIIAIIIASANVLAVVLDLVSVSLGEYTLSHAMIDIPAEAVSFFAIVIFHYAAIRLGREPQPGT